MKPKPLIRWPSIEAAHTSSWAHGSHRELVRRLVGADG